jgi:hypothetical protein
LAAGPSIRELLSGGDLRSIGRVPEVIGIVGKYPERIAELVRELDDRDPVVRSRAADALEKLTAKRPELLLPFREVLLRAAGESRQQEVRWHLAQMLPRLALRPGEILSAFSLLQGYREDRSVIVRVCAMQAMFELSLRKPSLRPRVRALVETSCRRGRPPCAPGHASCAHVSWRNSMAYDESVARRVREALGKSGETAEKKMFGGIAYMVRGNMCCGVIGDRLMVRVGPGGYEAALSRPHAKPMDFTGRPMKGFVYVEPAGFASAGDLKSWLAIAVDFVRTLPAK